MRRLAFLLALPLLAQSQSTFYAAFEDGQELEAKGDWRGALAAYQRAAALRPSPSSQVITYGNNLLKDYYPYVRMARCHLELGELEAAEAQLARAQAMREPEKDRENLGRRLKELQAARALRLPPPASTLPQVAQMPEIPAAQPLPAPAADSDPLTRSNPPSSAPRSVHPEPHEAPHSKAADGSEPPPTIPGPIQSASAPAPVRAPDSNTWWPWLLLLLLPLAALFWRRRPAAPNEFSEPEQVGPYRIERLLGRGGFASTYLARHETTQKPVALKRLHPYRLEDPEFLGRFHQEARLGARLNHPNLVALVDPGPSAGQPWIAMDYVEGENLDQRLKAEGRLPLPEVLRIARELAAGLSYAHDMGVVHRDLKPANIMLAAGGAKIMDFGIARVLDAETLTTTYAFLGTPRYAAPEAQMKTAVGPASDWYAFGIILFEMLAGTPPFKGETPFEILEHHRSQALPDLRPLRPDAPEPLVALVGTLCAKAPEARPRSGEILTRLAELDF
ncbi:MAG TPA: serine/threonine-protein kinase [Holophagaceae bacterium]|jgi:hypothetical protein|nr:serine/threonine-protein kinase [Holophagaceae bacterium]